MKKTSIKKFTACFLVFVLVFTMIGSPIGVNATYNGHIRRDFSEQVKIHNDNEQKFQELNKKIHSKNLKLFSNKLKNKLKKAKGVIVPALSAIIYLSVAMSCEKNKADIKTTSKHVAIAAGVGITSEILERLASYIIDNFI